MRSIFRYFVVGISLILSHNFVYGQSMNFLDILIDTINIGEYRDSGEKIIANEITYPFFVYDFHIDSSGSNACVIIRKVNKKKTRYKEVGELIVYDFLKDSLRWHKSIYVDETVINYYKNSLIYNVNYFSQSLDIKTNQENWNNKNRITLIEPKSELGIGYTLKAQSPSNILEAVDLKTGTPVWQRTLNRKHIWNDTLYLNDSVLLVVASGLHTINLFDGSGWDYIKTTEDKKYGGTILTNMIGISLGVLTGSYFYSYGYNVHGHLNSNVLVENENAFFASKENLVKLQIENGDVLWESDLSLDSISASTLYSIGDSILMINFGFAVDYGRKDIINYGAPFFAIYDKKHGEQLIKKEPNLVTKPILDYTISNGNLYLLQSDFLSSYSLKDGSDLKQKKFQLENEDILIGFANEQLYYKDRDSIYRPLIDIFDKSELLLTLQGNIFVYNEKDQLIESLDMQRIYHKTYDYKEITFLSQEELTIMINSNGNEVGRLNIPFEGEIVGDKMYLKSWNKLLVVDF